MESFINSVNWLAERLGTSSGTVLGILASLITLVGVLIGGFLTTLVYPLVKDLVIASWDKFSVVVRKKRFEYAYLDWVIEQHRFLPSLPSTLVPSANIEAQEIDDLYVELTLFKPGTVQEGISSSKALRENSALVIIGEPGSGKTTMLRFLTLNLARARRKRSIAHDKKVRQRRIVRTVRLKES